MKRKILSLAVLTTATMTNLLFSCDLKAMDKTSVVSEISNDRMSTIQLEFTPLSTYVPSIQPIVTEESVAGIENCDYSAMAVKESDKKKEVKKEDAPETIYDVYSEKEIEILQTIVEAEATGGNIENKQNVANVILNRVESDEFPDTIEKVVFQKLGKYYQFSPIADSRYYMVKVTKDTIKACEKAFSEKDTTNGSLYFDCAPNSWADRNRPYEFNDGLHNFYR